MAPLLPGPPRLPDGRRRARSTRALLTPLQNGSSTWSAQRRAASRSPSATASTVPTRVSQPRTSAPSDSSSTSASAWAKTCRAVVELALVEVGLGELDMARMRQKSIVSAGASARAVSSASARARSPSSRCANASATANSTRMMVMSATCGGATHAGSHPQGVQRPAGERLAQRPGPLERQATLRIAAQGDLGLPHLVGRIVPPLRQRHLACDAVGGEPAERVLPAGLPEVEPSPVDSARRSRPSGR